MLTDKGLCNSFNVESVETLFQRTEYTHLLGEAVAEGNETMG